MRNFGGRKANRYMANKERNQINIGTVKEQLANTLDESEVLNETLPVISTEDNADRLRPPINKEAESFDEIFKLNDVIPMELLNRLDEEAMALFAADAADIPISSDFLLNAIKALKLSPDSNEKTLKMKIIIYMDALQALIRSRGKLLKKIELSKITEKVENDVRERFSDDRAKYKRNAFSNEKALCYYLVLGFMLSDKHELDVAVLTEELGLPKTKIIKFAKLVCANMRARTTMLMVKLPKKVKAISFPYAGKRVK